MIVTIILTSLITAEGCCIAAQRVKLDELRGDIRRLKTESEDKECVITDARKFEFKRAQSEAYMRGYLDGTECRKHRQQTVYAEGGDFL